MLVVLADMYVYPWYIDFSWRNVSLILRQIFVWFVLTEI